MAEFAHKIDEGIKTYFKMCIGTKTETWINFAKERVCLPIKLK